MTRRDATLMDEASDPENAAGGVEAVRQSSREPLPEPTAGIESETDAPVVKPQRQHQAPVAMMIVLSLISLALGFGYVAYLIA
ncbi:hypothetical protein ACFOGJ_01870 [Marinibaculum pumilum]|uniref:Uncharacterized protein n=1 Tax=Marinibaculum pumilum TaxID=1766165 RepID=A0ABV7KV53_9PROT